MKIKVFTLNSFAKSEQGGNPAGVKLDADLLSEIQMRKIAELVGFSETAFVMRPDESAQEADFKLRFFTPNEEVDLCGHATIGAFYVLAATGAIAPGLYKQQTKAGILEVQIMEDSTVLMEQKPPEFYEYVNREIIADSLNIDVEDLVNELPIQVVSTGLKDIMVPVKGLHVLQKLKPDFKKITEVSKAHGVTGYHVFSSETLQQSSVSCRNFAPLYGIPEESATGTSNGALACYLFKHKVINAEQAKMLIIEQGYCMDKPSEIVVSLETEATEITNVRVGGRALGLSELEIELNID